METIDQIYIKVLYNGKNITADVSKSLMSLGYTDHMSQADTLDISLEDNYADCFWFSVFYRLIIIVIALGLLWSSDIYFIRGMGRSATIWIDGCDHWRGRSISINVFWIRCVLFILSFE